MNQRGDRRPFRAPEPVRYGQRGYFRPGEPVDEPFRDERDDEGYGRRVMAGRDYTQEREAPRSRHPEGYGYPMGYGARVDDDRAHRYRGRERNNDAGSGYGPVFEAGSIQEGSNAPGDEGSYDDRSQWYEAAPTMRPRSFSGQAEQGYDRPDHRIREDVYRRLHDNDEVDADAIDIHVERGEVTLSGTVGSRRVKRMAELLAETVIGVRDVHNRLRLSTPRA